MTTAHESMIAHLEKMPLAKLELLISSIRAMPPHAGINYEALNEMSQFAKDARMHRDNADREQREDDFVQAISKCINFGMQQFDREAARRVYRDFIGPDVAVTTYSPHLIEALSVRPEDLT